MSHTIREDKIFDSFETVINVKNEGNDLKAKYNYC